MTGEDSSYQAYTARKEEKLTHRRLDCGHRGDAYQHIWCDRLACRGCADLDHDCSAFGGAKSSTEEVPEPAEAAPVEQADLEFLHALDGFEAPNVRTLEMYSFGPVLNAPHPAWTWTDITEYATCSTPEVWRAANPALPYRCRGCRLWIAQDVKLCGPCSALPSCPAERSAVEWGGTVVCFRPGGHDGQHETVTGRCWMDAPRPVEPEMSECPDDSVIPPGLHRYECPHPHCSWVKVARYAPHLADLAEAHELASHARRPWWRRWPW